jgi:hypothetical protein
MIAVGLRRMREVAAPPNLEEGDALLQYLSQNLDFRGLKKCSGATERG